MSTNINTSSREGTARCCRIREIEATRSALLRQSKAAEIEQVLREINRIVVEPNVILTQLAEDCGVTMSDDPVQAIVLHAMRLGWTRDPFDRLLVATAVLHRAPLITRDQQMHLPSP